ncbi:MAG TPA: glycosyltransferase, partial [Anaerolineae bacterium]|nr:glycosyltransferase [Anaerolineae bacterium]
AMALLRDLPDAHLVIVGEGHERGALEAEIQRLDLTDRVTLTGRVSDQALEAYYQSCQVFALPAIVDESGDTEMLGMVSLEAMRYCKPVIASDVGGIPDIVVDGESGTLVPQKDPEALAAAIRRALTDPDWARRLGHGGYRFAQTHFSWDRVERATRAMYAEGSSRRFFNRHPHARGEEIADGDKRAISHAGHGGHAEGQRPADQQHQRAFSHPHAHGKDEGQIPDEPCAHERSRELWDEAGGRGRNPPHKTGKAQSDEQMAEDA